MSQFANLHRLCNINNLGHTDHKELIVVQWNNLHLEIIVYDNIRTNHCSLLILQTTSISMIQKLNNFIPQVASYYIYLFPLVYTPDLCPQSYA